MATPDVPMAAKKYASISSKNIDKKKGVKVTIKAISALDMTRFQLIFLCGGTVDGVTG